MHQLRHHAEDAQEQMLVELHSKVVEVVREVAKVVVVRVEVDVKNESSQNLTKRLSVFVE
jgi:hypothetical protein